MAQTVLILGAGVGGLVAARALRQRLPAAHRILLVDREPSFSFAASYLWVMTGQRRPEQITRPLDRLKSRGIEVLHGEVSRIDPERREVVVDGSTISADHLVVALGAESAAESVPGLSEGGHTFTTLDGAVRLRQALSGLREGRVLLLTASPQYRCPAAPYEAALLIDDLYSRQGIRDRITIDFFAAEPGPMGVAGPQVTAAVRSMVESRRIGYHPEHQVSRVDPHGPLAEFAGGAKEPYDLLVYVPAYRAPRAVRESALVGESGWVAVDRHTLATKFPGVWAVGDVTSIPLSLGKPLPKAGVFAHAQAEVVARTIAAEVTGKGRAERAARFDGHGACFVEAGAGRAGYGAGNFYGEPRPEVRLHRPARRWHLAKILFETHFLRKWA